MYEALKLLLSVIMIVMVVGSVGALLDLRQFEKGKKITRARKWLWNTVEMLVIGILITRKGLDYDFTWSHIAILWVDSWFMWRIVHDGFIGLGLKNDFLYVGKGAWDSKMMEIYNNKWLYFILNKCVPLGIFLGWFFGY